MSIDDFISVGDAAAMSGLSRPMITHLARRGEVLCRKVGNVWLVDRDSLRKYLANRPRPGRKSLDKR